MPKQCCGRTRFFPPICGRPASVERDGQWWCYQHDPERRRAKAAARTAQVRLEDAARELKFARQDLEREAGLCELTDADLRAIIAAGGMRKILAGLPS